MNELRASIDIGSNTTLLLAGIVKNGKLENELLNLSTVTSLGAKLDQTKKFQNESMDATFEALKNYLSECEKLGIHKNDILITATEASRVATNAPEFFAKIFQELGLKVEVISGEKEAELTTKGVLSDLKTKDLYSIIMDIGGASTELIHYGHQENKILESYSFKVGAVRYYDWMAENNVTTKCSLLGLDRISHFRKNKIIAVAGTMTALAAVYLNLKEFDEQKINGMKLTISHLRMLSLAISKTTEEEMVKHYPYLGKRAKTLYAGSLVAILFAEHADVEEFEISTRGLRYGTLIHGIN